MSKFQIGDSKAIEVQITDSMVRDFAKLSGDFNPIHLDDAFAATTRFKRRIAHGMIAAGLISRAVATELPGAGAVYLSQTLKFTAPVFIDDVIIIELKVKAIREEKNILTLETICRRKSNGETVLEGEALVLAPRN